MTAGIYKKCNASCYLANSFADDIMKMSDEEVLVEFREFGGDPNAHAISMGAFVENAIVSANKSRLAAARAGVDKGRQVLRPIGAPIDISEARKRLRSIGKDLKVKHPLTLAARNETELSDSDVLSMYEDLVELGVLPMDSSKDSKS